MHYFFVTTDELETVRTIELAYEDLHHAYRVLRLETGDRVAVADGRGLVRQGVIAFSEAHRVQVCLGDMLPPAESCLEITLFQSMAKGEKMDLIVRQAVELGVKKIVPVITGRSVPRWTSERESGKLKRLQSIVRSAAGQCRRAFLPQVVRPYDFKSLMPLLAEQKSLVPWEGQESLSLAQVLKQPSPGSMAVSLFIGPEGGFNSEEIETMLKNGAEAVHLGPRIMRTETAAAAAIALIQAAWGDLSGEGECN